MVPAQVINNYLYNGQNLPAGWGVSLVSGGQYVFTDAVGNIYDQNGELISETGTADNFLSSILQTIGSYFSGQQQPSPTNPPSTKYNPLTIVIVLGVGYLLIRGLSK